MGGELEIQAYYFSGFFFFFFFFFFFWNFYVFVSIVIFADFHRILAATRSNAVKSCEISNSEMLWEIPLTAFDTLRNSECTRLLHTFLTVYGAPLKITKHKHFLS